MRSLVFERYQPPRSLHQQQQHRTISSFLLFTFTSYLFQFHRYHYPSRFYCCGWFLRVPHYSSNSKNNHKVPSPSNRLYFSVAATLATTTASTVRQTTLSMTTTSSSTVESTSIDGTSQCPSTDAWDPNNPQHVEKAKQELNIWPLDEYNTKLLNEVHPIHYTTTSATNTTIMPEYDLIAIGSGAGGLVSSKQSARRNAKSALISAHLAGGDCLNVGVRTVLLLA
jgi:hypothetical protein